MSLAKFLDQWAKSHPVTEPTGVTDTEVLNYLTNGGSSPLPLWPKLKGKK